QLGLGDQLGDPARIDPFAGAKGAGGTGAQGGDGRRQITADQGAADDLVIDAKTVQVVLVEEVAEGSVADVVQQDGDAQRIGDQVHRIVLTSKLTHGSRTF